MSGVVKIDGRNYKTVATRVAEFREKHPIEDGWGIRTEVWECDPNFVTVLAIVTDPQGRQVGSGLAHETPESGGFNDTSMVEVAETSAIGRALASCGFSGSDQYASAEEVLTAKAVRETKKTKPLKEETKSELVGQSTETMADLVKQLESYADLREEELAKSCKDVADRFRSINTPDDQTPEKKKVIALLSMYHGKLPSQGK